MATLQEKIIEKLVAELFAKKVLSEEKIAALRDLLQRQDAKVRVDDLVGIFVSDEGDVA